MRWSGRCPGSTGKHIFSGVPERRRKQSCHCPRAWHVDDFRQRHFGFRRTLRGFRICLVGRAVGDVLFRFTRREEILDMPSSSLFVKTMSNPADRQSISLRLEELSPADSARWGSMSVHQMVCHLDDSYKLALGEKSALPATGFVQRTMLKWLALNGPMPWMKGFPTRPEVEQGKGGTVPVEFAPDLASLATTVRRFCDQLPSPALPHPIFGKMTRGEWMRWGYLHADHHLRQFGR